MINSVRTFKVMNNTQLKKPLIVNSQASATVSFKSGFERRNGPFNYGGMTVDSEKVQRMISKSLKKEQLEELLKQLEDTGNEYILYCYINRCGIFKNRLKAHFQCAWFLRDFTEYFKQKPLIESKWGFLKRMLAQFDEYRNQLLATKNEELIRKFSRKG